MGNVKDELDSLAFALVRQLQVGSYKIPSFLCECDEHFLELLPFVYELRKEALRSNTPI